MLYFHTHFTKYVFFFCENTLFQYTIFKHATGTKKALFTTLLTTYPALKNYAYLEEIESEVTMDKLFEESDS